MSSNARFVTDEPVRICGSTNTIDQPCWGESFGFDLADSAGGIAIARPAPEAELRDIDSANAGLAVIDPRLGAIEQLADLALRQASVLAQLPKQFRHALIDPVMLSLRCHQSLDSDLKAS